MLYAAKRLALGVLLIVATSAILLVADRGHRSAAARHIVRVAILQHASTPVLDDGVRGVIDGLAARGFRDGEQIAITRFNAQGDMPTGLAIARQVTTGDYDLVITSSTPSMQAVANSNRDNNVRHVFAIVADPFSAGIGLDRDYPLKHPPRMVGQSSFPPVETAFQLARRMLPGLQRVGVAWNPSESNSLAFMKKAREVSAAMRLTLLEANADTTSAVPDAVNSLIARGAQAIWVGGDNTVVAGVDSVIAISRRSGIPVFSVIPGAPDRGTLFDAGPDFYRVGRETGGLAADVLDGADMTRIPVRDVLDVVPPYLSVNTKALKGLKEAWRVPDAVLRDATVVVDDAGVHRKAAVVAGPVKTTKKWRLALVELNRVLDVEDAERGVLDGLREQGLVEGRDFEKTIRNAQGDMATVSALVDASVSDGADLLITFSTPTLQAALARAKRIPIVFNYVADPIAAGAGKSDLVHAPNVAGVYLINAYDQMLALIRRYVPKAHTLGTVYVPAEVNMVSQLAAMTTIARAAGMEVKAIAANSTAEVGEAALALTAAHVDVICQLPGNLTAAAFPSLAQASRRARVPIFGFQSSAAHGGAVLAVARDYYDSGREAAQLAARVMRGESPAGMPFSGFAKTTLIVNVGAAREMGLATPPDLLQQAGQVLGK
jgi:ABC-type uncharacterized transport system substrate-binding protein